MTNLNIRFSSSSYTATAKKQDNKLILTNNFITLIKNFRFNDDLDKLPFVDTVNHSSACSEFPTCWNGFHQFNILFTMHNLLNNKILLKYYYESLTTQNGIRTIPWPDISSTDNSPRTIPWLDSSLPDNSPIRLFPDRTFLRLKYFFHFFSLIIFIRCYVYGFFLTQRIIFFLLSRTTFSQLKD